MALGNLRWNGVEIQVQTCRIGHFKDIVVDNFAGHSSTEVFTVKFHLIDNMVEDIHRFGKLSVLDISPFEGYNVPIKASYGRATR